MDARVAPDPGDVVDLTAPDVWSSMHRDHAHPRRFCDFAPPPAGTLMSTATLSRAIDSAGRPWTGSPTPSGRGRRTSSLASPAAASSGTLAERLNAVTR